MRVEKRYLGDGVYAEYDGYHIVLTAEDGARVTDMIYLDAQVLNGFDRFREAVRKGQADAKAGA